MAVLAVQSGDQEEILKERVRNNLKFFEEFGVSREVLEFAKRQYKLWVDQEDRKLRFYQRSTSSTQNAGRGYTGRYATDAQKYAALERAERLQTDLKLHYPSFIKPMVRSHVSGGFWLGLPVWFCKDNLPPTDLRMILEDEKGKEHDVLYLGRKNGLSGGWRGFAIDHSLENGDAIVFELTKPARFKVYIVKAIDDEQQETKGTTAKTKAKAKTDGKKSTTAKKRDQPELQKQPPKSSAKRARK